MSEEKTKKLPMKEFWLSTLQKKSILVLTVFTDLATISRTTCDRTFWMASEIVAFITQNNNVFHEREFLN